MVLLSAIKCWEVQNQIMIMIQFIEFAELVNSYVTSDTEIRHMFTVIDETWILTDDL